MDGCRKWILSLVVFLATPLITFAEPPTNGDDKPNPLPVVDPQFSGRPSAIELSDNQRMAEAIAKALREAGFRGYDIEISYRNGVAKVVGKVSGDAQLSEVTKIVSNVAGVKTIDNRLKTYGIPDVEASHQTGRKANLPEHAWPSLVPAGQMPRFYIRQFPYLPIPNTTPLGPPGDWNLTPRKNDI